MVPTRCLAATTWHSAPQTARSETSWFGSARWTFPGLCCTHPKVGNLPGYMRLGQATKTSSARNLGLSIAQVLSSRLRKLILGKQTWKYSVMRVRCWIGGGAVCVLVEDTLLKQELEAEACRHVRSSSPMFGKGCPTWMQKVLKWGNLSRNWTKVKWMEHSQC